MKYTVKVKNKKNFSPVTIKLVLTSKRELKAFTDLISLDGAELIEALDGSNDASIKSLRDFMESQQMRDLFFSLYNDKFNIKN